MLKQSSAALVLIFTILATSSVAADQPPIEGAQYDAMLAVTVEDAEDFEYRLEAPAEIDGMEYAMAVLIYSDSTVIDGYDRTGPLIDMKEHKDRLYGWFEIPEESRVPRVWAVVYYGKLGHDEPWLRAYSLVIDFPDE